MYSERIMSKEGTLLYSEMIYVLGRNTSVIRKAYV